MMKQTWNEFEEFYTSYDDQLGTGERYSLLLTVVNGPIPLKRKCIHMSNNDVDVTDITMNSLPYGEKDDDDDDDLEMKVEAVNNPTALKRKFNLMSNNDLDSTVTTTMNLSSFSDDDDDGEVKVEFNTHSLSDCIQRNNGGLERMEDVTCNITDTKPDKDPERMEYYDHDQHTETMDTACDHVFETSEYFFVDQYSAMEPVTDDMVRDGWKREQFRTTEDRLLYRKSKERA